MSKKLSLNIQHFAEAVGSAAASTGEQTTLAETQTQATTIDYDKIADIVSKRSSSTEDSVLKGYFKQQGLDEKQMGEAIASYKQAQVAKQQEEAQRISNLQKENERMKAQILNSQIDTKVSEMAGGLGVDPAKQPFLLKLIERKELANDKGEIQEDKIKAAVDAVLKAFPDFKSSIGSSNTGFQRIGAGASGAAGSELDAKLDAAFGITKK